MRFEAVVTAVIGAVSVIACDVVVTLVVVCNWAFVVVLWGDSIWLEGTLLAALPLLRVDFLEFATCAITAC